MQFHAETGGYDVKTERDERSFVNKGNRKSYRYQVQGPNAAKVMRAATGKPMPDIKFFNMSTVRIAGKKVRALRHGMVGAARLGALRPVGGRRGRPRRAARGGRDFGIRRVGARTYPTSTLESGWIPSPLPAVYTGEKMKTTATGSRATAYEALASLGGSFVLEEDRGLLPHAVRLGLRRRS